VGFGVLPEGLGLLLLVGALGAQDAIAPHNVTPVINRPKKLLNVCPTQISVCQSFMEFPVKDKSTVFQSDYRVSGELYRGEGEIARLNEKFLRFLKNLVEAIAKMSKTMLY
jgi:hypothetical protein